MIRPLSVLSLVCTLVWLMSPLAAADEQSAIAAVESAGGTVRLIAKDSTEKEAAFHLSSTDVTDEALVPLHEIEDLVWLNLRGTKITDDGLQQIAGIKSLKRLHLENTQITDEGLKHLSGLENLEYLNLYGTKVTDAGLEHLKGLKNLKKLYVWQTGVTKEGAAQLKEAIPGLYVNLGAEAEPGPPTKTLAMGRYVKVRLEGEKRILSLAEVEVVETASGKKLQTEGQAIQSSVHDGADAPRAIDGNTDGDYTKGSVTHTAEEKNPWWLLDLGDVKDIGEIVVHNRKDCCGDRLEGATVEVFDRGLNIVWTGTVTGAKEGSVTKFRQE